VSRSLRQFLDAPGAKTPARWRWSLGSRATRSPAPDRQPSGCLRLCGSSILGQSLEFQGASGEPRAVHTLS